MNIDKYKINVEFNNKILDVEPQILDELQGEQAYLFSSYNNKLVNLNPLIQKSFFIQKSTGLKEFSDLKIAVYCVTSLAGMLLSPVWVAVGCVSGIFWLMPLLPLQLFLATYFLCSGLELEEDASSINNLKTAIRDHINFINSDHSELKAKINSTISILDSQISASHSFAALQLKHQKVICEHQLKVLESYAHSKWKVIT